MQANSIGIAGTELDEHRHICALFSSRDESYRVLLPFVKDGFECGDRAFHVVDPALRDDHLHRLEDAAIATESARRTGQFRIGDWNEAYLAGGGFDQDRMLALLDGALNDAPEQPLVRLVCDMQWALLDRPGTHALVEYESRFNTVLRPGRDVVVCCYDLAKFNRPDHGRAAHAPDGDPGRRPVRQSVLRAARAVSARIAHAAAART